MFGNQHQLLWKKGIDITGITNTPLSMGLIPQQGVRVYNKQYKALGTIPETYVQVSWTSVNINDYYANKINAQQTTTSVWDIYMRDFIFTYYKKNSKLPFVDMNGFVTRDVEKELLKIIEE